MISAPGFPSPALYLVQCPVGGGNCNYGDMDLSPSLFQYFNDLGVGKFAMEWDFADGSAPATTPHQDPPSSYVEPPSPTTPTQDSTPVIVAPPPPTTPIIDSSPVYENAVAPTDEAPAVDVPTTTSDYVDPTPTPWTESTDYSTTTDSAPAATATTTPTFGEQLAMAMKDNDVSGLGSVLVELGYMLQNSTTTSTTDTSTATTTTY